MRCSGRLADKGRPTGFAELSMLSTSTSTADKIHSQTHIGSSPRSIPSAEPSTSTSIAYKSHPKTHIGSNPRSTPSAESLNSTSTVEVARAKLESLEKDSIPFRLLEALLKHAPTVEGVNVIITDTIAASAEPNGLDQLAEFYKTGLLIPSKLPVIAGGRTPQVSFHPSRDQQIQVEVNRIAANLEIAKRDPVTLNKYTLYRDDYRCVVTHRWDFTSLSLPEVKTKFDASTPLVTVTETAHILPFSLMSADTNKTLFKKCTIWSVIASFTNIKFINKELSGNNINSLTNVITLDIIAHKYFGQLYLWFEAVPGRVNTYIVKKAYDYVLEAVGEGTEVNFTSPNPEMYPLPDPRYLAFHATVAKVVHMAGIAEHLDDILQKYENIRVLSDESGVEYLDGLLRVAQRYINT